MAASKLSMFLFILFFLTACSEDTVSESPVVENNIFETPTVIAGKIKRGINIGNTLEPPQEGGWNTGPMREYYFDDILDAGFSCVRIPVRWDEHTAITSPFDIEEAWLDRVEQVVDWGLSKGLYLIINAHHESWLKDSNTFDENKPRFKRIWEQISERFSGKPGRLLFEILNEPHGLTVAQVDEINRSILAVIRELNPKRTVIFSGNDWSNAEHLFTAAIPEDDYLMAYYHSYDPWDFAGESNGTWGSFEERETVRQKFESVAHWSETNNIPVMISEFGANINCDYNSRMYHYFSYVEFALKYGVIFQAWDDDGDFRIYDRENRQWSEIKDILIKTCAESPAALSLFYVEGNNIYLTWNNRSDNVNKLVLERKINSGQFIGIAELESDINQYQEKYYTGGDTLYYRVIAITDNEPDMHSNPVRVIIP